MSFFLFSLRRRTWSPFSSKKFFVLLAQVSSAAILFAENRYTEQFFVVFFFTEKKKFFLRIFFLKLENQVQKFPGRTKIADFRKNAEDWKHCALQRNKWFATLPFPACEIVVFWMQNYIFFFAKNCRDRLWI